MIKTENFSNMKFWIGRITISLVLFLTFVYFFLVGQENMLFGWILSICILLIMIVFNQVGDLKIENQKLTFEVKSLIPFLRDKTEIDLTTIDSISLKSDQTTNERGFMVNVKLNKNVLEIRTNNGSEFRIPGKIYPEGASALMKIIESKRSR
jgi:hypothetical protein